ncbi:MAG: peptidoglycan editing factor PgeF [Clostridia bacterium]|nr:peptidoglycan editing factor PgeF [Clostridia bacterium]
MVLGGFSDYKAPSGANIVLCNRLSEFSELRHGFSTALGGVSEGCFSSLNLSFGRGDLDGAVCENFRRFALSAGLSKNAYAFTRQVHGNYVRTVSLRDVSEPDPCCAPPECDGLVTAEAGVPLLGKTADCVPILLYAPKAHICAFAHAGWRGTAAKIAEKAVLAMVSLGAESSEIIAAVGPSISPCCFLTHSDVTDAMTPLGRDILKNAVSSAPDGRSAVDLKRINGAILESCGVGEVYVSTECTCCGNGKYFSHRKSGPARGSMAAVIEMI